MGDTGNQKRETVPNTAHFNLDAMLHFFYISERLVLSLHCEFKDSAEIKSVFVDLVLGNF